MVLAMPRLKKYVTSEPICDTVSTIVDREFARLSETEAANLRDSFSKHTRSLIVSPIICRAQP